MTLSKRPHRKVAIWVFAILLPHAPVYGQSVSDIERVAGMIEATNAGSNLRALARQVAPSTVTFGVLHGEVGAKRALALLEEALITVQPRFQEEWNKKLAAAHLKYLPVEELESIRVHGPKSPYAPKLARNRSSIGIDMKATAKEVLVRYVSAALTTALDEAEK